MSDRGVTSLNEDGGRPPVVFVSTWRDDAEQLSALAAFLGPDQPIYGIDPPDEVKGSMPADVAEWVAHARPRLDGLPIDPPYRLGGFSFGGVVALELARQLEADGRTVEWVGLVDTLRPMLNPKGLPQYTRYHLQELLDLPDIDHRRAYAYRLARGGTYRTLMRIKNTAVAGLAAVHLTNAKPKTPSEQRDMRPLKVSIWKSYLGYEATPYDHPVALFAGHGNRFRAAGDISLRWSRYFRGGFEVTEIDGNHLELFSPENIHSVGTAIRDSLARCQGINSTRPNAVRLSR